MTLFLLHENNGRQDDKNLICLPDRFNWFAFLLPPIWALSNKLWFIFIAMILFMLSLNFVSEFLILPTLALYILAALWLGFEANSIVGNSFVRQGWRALNPIVAIDRVRAEQRYFGRTKRQVRRIERENIRMQRTHMQDNGVVQDLQSIDLQSMQKGSVE